MSKPYEVFCSAKLQWNGRKLEPFKRSRSMGIAEAECRRLARENPGSVAVALGPGFRYTVEPISDTSPACGPLHPDCGFVGAK